MVSSTESEIEIIVKNAEGDPDTKATIIHQNSIDYEPKVSVIIPVYNTEEYLRECLDSVVNQTLKEIEIICVDDGSTDSSLEILKEYAQKDNRITIITQKNLHAGVARNAGFSVARGEYLSFLDSDDWFELNMLDRTYNQIKKDNSDILVYNYNNYNQFSSKNESIRGINFKLEKAICYKTIEIKETLFTNCNPMPWNKIFNKSFIEKNNIKFQNLTACNDVYFSMLAMACSNSITYIPDSLCSYRYNRHSSLKNTRDKNPYCFFHAYKNLCQSLNSKRLFSLYKETFFISLCSSTCWTLSHTNDSYSELRQFIKNTLIPYFKLDGKNKKFMTPKLSNIVKRNGIIVSLTSYPERINTVHIVIESLLNQSLCADKVILWLSPEQFPNKEADLPIELLNLKEKGLTIDWYHDIKSYKKLIPALKKFPNEIIVTADDDLIYEKQWLESLIKEYETVKNKKILVTHRVTRLYKRNSELDILNRLVYIDKKTGNYNKLIRIPSVYNKLCTGAGTVFPPNCFDEDVYNEEKFMEICPTSDDLWFYIMALKNGYKIKATKADFYRLNSVPNSQETALCKINDKNQYEIFFSHLYNIVKEYNLWVIFNKYCTFNNFIISFLKRNSSVNKEKNRKNKIQLYAEDLKEWYKRVHKKDLDLESPKTFNEKIQWLKLYDSTPIKTRLADKYLVRDWVKETIGEEYLIPLLGVYDNFDEIDFDKLPNQFVMKCNHASGWNLLVRDKTKLNLKEAKEKFDKWLSRNFAFVVGYELHYREIKPKIVIEKFIDEISENIYDYRFFCCNGKVEQVWLDVNSGTPQHKRKIYNRNWKELDIVVKWPRLETDVLKPQNLDEMIKLSEHLSKNFAFVRVDFYDVNNKIYFGEMTFTSMSGIGQFEPEIECLKLGRKIKLPKLAYNIDTGEYYKLPNYKLKYFMQNIFSIKNEPIRKKHKIVTVAGLKLKVKRKHVTGYSLLEKMFSVKNEPIRKQHKVITILGFKFKIKRKAYGEYSFIEKIFSVKNKESRDNKWYKVITIFGVKFKFKNKDLMLRKNLTMLNSKFEEQMFNASKQYSILKNQNNELVKLINQMKSNNEEIQTQNKILKDQNNKNRFTQKDAQNTIAAILKRIYPKPYLRNFVVDITHHCNLNCKGCDHFSPLAEPAFYDLEQYKKDIACLSKLTSGNIDRVGIMGGEPLLNPDVLEYLKTTRQYFPETKIRLVTNGILLSKQSEEFWLTLKELNIFIEYTKYDLKLDYDYIDSVIKKYGVPIDVYGYDQNIVKTSYKIPLDLKGNQDPILNFFKCSHANECITLKNGRIYTCTVAPNIEHFNKHFGYNIPLTERDGIDIYKAKSVEEILEFISKPIPFCKYCNVNGRTFGHKWEISKKDVNEWT